MTDVDRVRDAEQRLREDLRRALVPPPTPPSLASAVERLANDPPRQERALRAPDGRRRLEAVAGIAAVVTVVIGLWALVQVRDHDQVATSPQPTLPAVVASPLPSGTAKPTRLDAAAWIDASTIWARSAVGGPGAGDQPRTLRISEDGGQTWSEARAMPGDDVGFDMFDADHGYLGWALRSGSTFQAVLYRTSDGGRAWGEPIVAGSLQDAHPDETEFFVSVSFTDPDHGVFLATSRKTAAGGQLGEAIECASFATDDGGATWSRSTAPCLGPDGVTWFTRSIGTIAAGSDARVWLTLDGGRSWVEGQVPVQALLGTFRPLVVTAPSGGPIRMLGVTLPPEGAPRLDVFESAEGGATWIQHYVPIGLHGDSVRDVVALDGSHWLAASDVDNLGGMDLLESSDAGRTWAVAAHAAVQPGSPMRWVDRLHGTLQAGQIVCDGVDCHATGTVLLTNDGGQTWTEVPF